LQPNVYFDGMDPTEQQASVMQDGPKEFNPVIALTAVAAVGAAGAVGYAVFLYVTQ
jgi:hypothetical protein